MPFDFVEERHQCAETSALINLLLPWEQTEQQARLRQSRALCLCGQSCRLLGCSWQTCMSHRSQAWSTAIVVFFSLFFFSPTSSLHMIKTNLLSLPDLSRIVKNFKISLTTSIYAFGNKVLVDNGLTAGVFCIFKCISCFRSSPHHLC